MNNLIAIDKIEATGGTNFYVRFSDGLEGTLDYTKHFNLRGLGQELLDDHFFKKISIDSESGNPCWPNGVDICRDYLYQIIAKNSRH
jgi:hypothetical protein